MRRISLVWLLILSAVWGVLAYPRTDAWVAGGLAVGLGILLHTSLGGRGSLGFRPIGLLGFVPFFLEQSVRGGIDVAWRALTPSLPIAPRFLAYRIRLPSGPARVFFVNCTSLLPGTFSAVFEGRRLYVHALTDDGSVPGRLARLEARVATLFGLELPDSGAPGEPGVP